MRKARMLALATIMGVASTFTVGVNAAQAAPTNCSVGLVGSRDGSWAWCTGGTGQFRAYTRCDRPFGLDYNRYGPWINTGPSAPTSNALCDSGHRAFDYGYSVRN